MNDHSGPFLLVNPDRCMGALPVKCLRGGTFPFGALSAAMVAGETLSPRNRVVQVAATRFPTQCRQCEDAPCVRVCPTGATYQTATYTAVNQKLCIACKLCMMVCPFGAIQYQLGSGEQPQQAGRRQVRPMCGSRGRSACVAACPTHAISLAHPRAVMNEANQDSAQRFLARSRHRTAPPMQSIAPRKELRYEPLAESLVRSIDPATQEMLDLTQKAGIETIWDRFDAMQPQCGFGETGLCCRNCNMGPCRISRSTMPDPSWVSAAPPAT